METSNMSRSHGAGLSDGGLYTRWEVCGGEDKTGRHSTVGRVNMTTCVSECCPCDTRCEGAGRCVEYV